MNVQVKELGDAHVHRPGCCPRDREVVRLTKQGVVRVLNGHEGMTFIVDSITETNVFPENH